MVVTEFNKLLASRQINSLIIQRAFSQAEKSHSKQKRFDGSSVLEGHILPVAAEVIISYGSDVVPEIAVASALLHDAVEDDPEFSEQQLRYEYPADVANIVMTLTKSSAENEHPVWGEEFFTATQKILKRLENSSHEARIVKLADRTVNLLTIDDFKGSRPAEFKRFVEDTRAFFVPFAQKYSAYFYQRITDKINSL